MDTTAQPAIDQPATTANASADATATKAAPATKAATANKPATAIKPATDDREIAELELALAEPPAQVSGPSTRTQSATGTQPRLVTGSAASLVTGSAVTSRAVTLPAEPEPTVSEAEAGWLFTRSVDAAVELVGYLVIIGATILAFITMYWHIGDFDAGAPAFIAIADKALMLIGTLVGSCIGGLVAFLLRRGLKQQRRRAIAQYEAAARLAARRQEAQRIRAQRLAVEQTPINR